MQINQNTISDAKGHTQPEPEYYSLTDLSILLSIPRRTLEKWTLKGLLPVIKAGRLNRYPRVEINKRLLNGSLLK